MTRVPVRPVTVTLIVSLVAPDEQATVIVTFALMVPVVLLLGAQVAPVGTETTRTM